MSLLDTPLTRQLGIEVPLICGAMYPCTNPELVAAVSAAGGIGVVQPLSMIYVYGLFTRALLHNGPRPNRLGGPLRSSAFEQHAARLGERAY